MKKQISDFTVQRVREESILEVLPNFVSDLKKQGANYVCTSPFNPDERTPSFHVSPTKNLWKDFSSDQGGDTIKFIMDYKKLSFYEAIEEICLLCQIPLEYENISPGEFEEKEKQRTQRKQLQEVLGFALLFYQSQELPEEYLKKRNIGEEACNSFRLGYAPDSWDDFYKEARSKGFTTDILLNAGLIRKNHKNGVVRYTDYFRNRLMFPILDTAGNPTAFIGRLIEDNSKLPKYLNSPDTCFDKSKTLYGMPEALKSLRSMGQLVQQVYIVEGPTDLIQLWQKGIRNVVATLGTAFSEHHARLIKRYCKKAIIIPDQGTAGNKAMHRAAEILIQQGIDTYVVLINQEANKEYDPDDYVNHLGNQESVKNWLSEDEMHYITNMCVGMISSMDKDDHSKRVEQIKRLIAILGWVKDKMLHNSYYDAICTELKDFKNYYKLKNTESNKRKLLQSEKEMYQQYGFWIRNTGLWTYVKEQECRVANFTISYPFGCRRIDLDSEMAKLC